MSELNWIPVSQKYQTACKQVLVVFEMEHGVKFITMAQYVPPKTLLAEDFLSEEAMGTDFPEYDEEKDCYWAPGGFYEWQYVPDQNWFLDENITHWAPLPLLP